MKTRDNSKMKTRNESKWRFLSILLLVGWMGIFTQARGAEYPNYNGETSGTFQLKSNYHASGTIEVNGTLTILAGSSGHTIMKDFSGGPIFKVPSGSKLIIKGASSSLVIALNGTIQYTSTNDARTPIANAGHGQGCAIWVLGSVELEYVHILNFWNANSTVSNPSANTFNRGEGAAILSTNSNTDNSTNKTIKLTHVKIYGCGAAMGPAFCSWGNDLHTCTFTDVEIYKCHAQGTYMKNGNSTLYVGHGIIRTTGSSKASMVLDDCLIRENLSDGVASQNPSGGAITWLSGGESQR